MAKQKRQRRVGGVPEFARVPGWIVGEGIYAKLTFKARVLLTVLYLHANAKERKVTCFVETLCREAGLSRRHVGLAKKELCEAGLLAYDYAQKGSRHTIWMAGDRAYQFHFSKESYDYLRSLEPTTRGLDGCAHFDPGPGPIVPKEVEPSVAESSSESAHSAATEQKG